MSLARTVRNAIFGKPAAPKTVWRVHPPRPPRGVKLIKPNQKPIIVQRGWRRTGFNTWKGHYATKYGTWPGRIEKRGDIFDVYIKKPPPEVRRYSGRFQCFLKTQWWLVEHSSPQEPCVRSALRRTSLRRAAPPQINHAR